MLACLFLMLSMVMPMFFNTTLHAEPCVAPIPGENLWRLTSRIGTCLDLLISQMEDCCSTLEACCQETISAIESSSDFLCTCVNTHTDSVADALEASICDCVDIAAASVSDAVCSCVDVTLFSVSDVLTSLIESTSDTVCICVNTHTDSVADALEASICDCVDTAAASVADAVCSCVDQSLFSVSDVLTSLIDACCCPNLITSVPFIITTPGHYCLADSVSYSTAAGFTAITIDSDDVILDLQDNLMQRTVANVNAGTTGAVVCNGDNCIIQNGLIDADNIIVAGQNVIVRNIHIDATLTETDSSGGGIYFQLGGGQGTVENCSVRNKGNVGILVEAGFVLINNSQFYRCPSGIFINTGGNQAQIIDCIGSDNVFNGFVIGAPEVTVDHCLAANNGDTGFNINQPDAVITHCISRDHSQGGGTAGFLVDTGGDGAALSYNIADTNTIGFRINNIGAEASFTGVIPDLGTWNIGLFGPHLATTTSRRIRLSYNIASNNTAAYRMFGLVYSNNSGVGPFVFDDFIYPPIGVMQLTEGIVQPNPNPISLTTVSALGFDMNGNPPPQARIISVEGGNLAQQFDAAP